MRFHIDDVDRSFYRILDVDERASLDGIRAAHRRLARMLHPDRQAGATERERQLAERRMREVNEAWTVLSDPTSRDAYDEALRRARLKAEADRVGGNGVDGARIHRDDERSGGLGGSLPDNFEHADPAYARAFGFGTDSGGLIDAEDLPGRSKASGRNAGARDRKRRNVRGVAAVVVLILVAGAFLVMTAYAGNTGDSGPPDGSMNDPIATIGGQVGSTIEPGD